MLHLNSETDFQELFLVFCFDSIDRTCMFQKNLSTLVNLQIFHFFEKVFDFVWQKHALFWPTRLKLMTIWTGENTFLSTVSTVSNCVPVYFFFFWPTQFEHKQTREIKLTHNCPWWQVSTQIVAHVFLFETTSLQLPTWFSTNIV